MSSIAALLPTIKSSSQIVHYVQNDRIIPKN